MKQSSSTPSAIPCVYSGVQMESRLEARWAAFFDGLGIPWVYEPAHYLKRGQDYQYTPDFALPSLDVLAEVKPDPPALPHDLSEKYAAYWPWLVERGKCRMFVYLVGYPHPGASYPAHWKHGSRWFRFERVFGWRAVNSACAYSDHLSLERMPAIEPAFKSSWCLRFAGMTHDEIMSDEEFIERYTAYSSAHQ